MYIKRKNKIIAFFITLLFSGPGMIFYVNTLRGFIVTGLEAIIIIKFGMIPGLAIGTIISIYWSCSYITVSRRVDLYNTLHNQTINFEECPDTLLLITTPDGLNKIYQRLSNKIPNMQNQFIVKDI